MTCLQDFGQAQSKAVDSFKRQLLPIDNPEPVHRPFGQSLPLIIVGWSKSLLQSAARSASS
jgi:hypothetical protein